MAMYYVFLGVYALICLMLLVVVLLQQGKGGDIAAAFGGSSSQAAFGARAGATVLTRATSILGALFMLGALALAIMGSSGGFGGSVVSGLDAPAAPATAAPATDPLMNPGALPATPPDTATAPPTAPPTTPPTTLPGQGRSGGGGGH